MKIRRLISLKERALGRAEIVGCEEIPRTIT
jgi:hypothetical protein